MTRNGDGTFGVGNNIGPGKPRGRSNSALLELHRIGEERVKTHYDMLDKLASEGDKDVAMFLVNKVLPNAKGSRAMSFPLTPINTLEDIAVNQSKIYESVGEGLITVEEGEKLYSMIRDRQKTIEMIDFAAQMLDINTRMAKAGI